MIGSLISGLAGGVIGGLTHKKPGTAGYDKAGQMYNQYADSANHQFRGDIANTQALGNNMARQGQNIADQYGWQNRLNAANAMRQDANSYEMNKATQGALAAFGGSPLSGNARNAVSDRQQMLARQNWQSSLDNANSMLEADRGAKLGVHGQNFGAQMGLGQNMAQGSLGIGLGKATTAASVEQMKQDAKNANKGIGASIMQGIGTGLEAGSYLPF